jgi:hypothetical protein
MIKGLLPLLVAWLLLVPASHAQEYLDSGEDLGNGESLILEECLIGIGGCQSFPGLPTGQPGDGSCGVTSMFANPTEALATANYLNLTLQSTGSSEFGSDMWIAPVDIYVSNLYATVNTAPGNGDSVWTLHMRADSGSGLTDTDFACSITDTETVCMYSQGVTIEAGSTVNMKITSSGTIPTSATEMTISFCVTDA